MSEIPKELLEAIDVWREGRPVAPSRDQAIVILVEMGLALCERVGRGAYRPDKDS